PGRLRRGAPGRRRRGDLAGRPESLRQPGDGGPGGVRDARPDRGGGGVRGPGRGLRPPPGGRGTDGRGDHRPGGGPTAGTGPAGAVKGVGAIAGPNPCRVTTDLAPVGDRGCPAVIGLGRPRSRMSRQEIATAEDVKLPGGVEFLVSHRVAAKAVDADLRLAAL